MDSLHGDDPFLADMANLGITPTVAESFEDFAALLQAGGWDLAILLDQNYGYTDPPWLASMLDWVNASGRSIVADWTMNETADTSWTGITGADGAVTFQRRNAPSGTYTTIVTAVSAAGLSWDGLTPPNEFTK